MFNLPQRSWYVVLTLNEKIECLKTVSIKITGIFMNIKLLQVKCTNNNNNNYNISELKSLRKIFLKL